MGARPRIPLEHNGRVYKVSDILDKLRNLKALRLSRCDDKGQPSIGDKASGTKFMPFDLDDTV